MFKRLVTSVALAVLASPLAFALEDPTRPPISGPVKVVKVSQKLPRLASVLLSEERRVAVLDGKPVSEGDSHAGFEVVQIAREGVTVLSPEGKRLQLSLASNKVKKDFK